MTTRTAEPLHILFVLHHPGFIRHYETTLGALAEKGHRVTLSFNLERNKIGEQVQMRRLLERYPAIQLAPMPEPTLNRWHYLATAVRLLQDYARYFDPRYCAATALRARAADELPPALEWLCRICCRFEQSRALFASCLRAAERVIPLNEAIHDFLDELKPDVLLITPLVDWGSDQVHCLKSAEALGIPSALCVASWDNLTNKGAIRYAPTRVIVWNAAQQREAVEFHDVPASRVVVTGAQTFDHWFTRRPSRSREAFCAQLGLDPGQPILLYLGSSFFIAPDEAQFFDRFLRAMRQSADPRLRHAGVIVRPHPLNIQQWLAFDFSGMGRVTVFPNKSGVEAFSEAFRADFYDSLHHAAAAVGVNTSAMIEAGIVGRPVFTVLAPEFRHSQEGTIHFRHLTSESGGVARVCSSIDEALDAIGHALSNPDEYERKARRYIEAFVRPNGWDTPASEHLQRAIQTLASRVSPLRWRRQLLGRFVLLVPSLYALLLLAPKEKTKHGPLGPVQGAIVRGAFVLLLQVAVPVVWAKTGTVELWRLLRRAPRQISRRLELHSRSLRRMSRESLHQRRRSLRRILSQDWVVKQCQRTVFKPMRRIRRHLDELSRSARRAGGSLSRRTGRLAVLGRRRLLQLARGIVRRLLSVLRTAGR